MSLSSSLYYLARTLVCDLLCPCALIEQPHYEQQLKLPWPLQTLIWNHKKMLLYGLEAQEILFYWNFLFYMFLRMWSDLPGYSWDLKILLHVALSELYRREDKRLLCWRVTTAMIIKGPLRCVSHLKKNLIPAWF